MGRKKTYATAAALRKAVEKYFSGISRLESVKVQVPTGDLDKYGHEIMRFAEVENELGDPIKERVFYIPPERYGLTASLGISVDTWDRYAEDADLGEVVRWAEEQIEGWKNRELLKRENKRTAGLIYEIERNHRRRQFADDSSVRTTPMVAFTDAQLLTIAAQMGGGE